MGRIESLITQCPDADALLDEASKATGLTDFGDPRLRTPLEAYIESFRKDAWHKMTAQARAYAVSTTVDFLGSRFKIAADRKRYPEIAREQVKQPFIVVGPPRSGSTLLNTLLSLDPEAMSTPFWACLEPSPPPGLGEPTAKRLAAVDARLEDFLDHLPQMRIMHSYYAEEGAGALGEDGHDIMVMAQTTKGMWYFYPIDGYLEYLLSAEHEAALDFHHDFLQHCQWRVGGKTSWALKAADHQIWLRTLHARYPDAALIWTHRDLSEQLGSAASVFCAGRTLSAPVPDEAKRDLGRQAVELERRIVLRALEMREELGEERFYDVAYQEMMADPVATIERIYVRFGREFTPQFAERIRTWVRQNPQTKHGVHKHSPDEFGLDADTINRDFAQYVERFGFGFGIRRSLIA
jgi:hypothetical protein